TSRSLEDQKGRAVNTLVWWPLLPPGVQLKTDVGGRYSVDVTDVPPTPDEDWMPPIRSLLYRVEFYYTYAHSAAEFWNSEAKSWSKEVNHFAEPTTPIKQAVNSLTAPGDSEQDKARK